MKVYSFVGASGSGKSHHASSVAGKYGIKYIIDDGLLICENRIVSGFSAKREKTKLSAIRRAIFAEEEHVKEVKKSLEELKPDKILILGTSDKMVDKIAERLSLPPVSERIYVENILSPEEIEVARKKRYEEGKHVIPVPTFEVKKHFSGYFIDPLRIFRRKEIDFEKTVVRPYYSYLGKYTISENVINSIVFNEAKKFDGIYKINKVITENYTEGIIIKIEIVMVHGTSINGVLRGAIKKIKSVVEYMTSLNVLDIKIHVKSLYIRDSDKIFKTREIFDKGK
ncbi:MULTISPECIES: Asp23/Gls24 family envelope stress response protein [Thermoanaerobacterium]|uniref:Alkaline shock family protein YloU n=1 Tax=Thermoanaerobacterium butyriciformans TaxID=1702242 RepID=A0ABS4NFN9_9THEO|nr:Asp23/Gls24 family envelope stress response protein [Thermoanaerobacterium butyriciformans]MBP2071843.1 putative alkaline shock family protein YloU [Thermoanaerobacterium butyriciformans]WHE06651.1 Asp23/Gls24 family envelope stress response protein [Thermoanaerobacterium thermosaccharolyticum]